MVAIPAGALLSRELEAVTLVDSSGSVAVAAILGASAIVFARRARERIVITLGRARGGAAARIGSLLGIVGLLAAAAAAVALAFWGLLSLFAQ